jgi:erythronate-4-phosphate dehydrogenase
MRPDPPSIVVDENIPYAFESFGRIGTVRILPGRHISAADVSGADILIVRSVTRVDEQLLAGSRVRFVGTATIGCDHVDLEYLAANGIGFASAPGSNANSVAEYVVAALLRSARARNTSLDGSTIAIVGVGNVGSRVAAKAEALGMRCLLNDPPRRRQTGDPVFVPLEDAIARADYATLHVPLERRGPDATVGMAGSRFFDTIRPGAVFLNTSRGAAVDEAALALALDSTRVSQAILDVWQNEPDIDPAIVRRAFIGTPHIAGYSYDGKVAATLMLYSAVCQWLNHPEAQPPDLSAVLPPPAVPRVDLTGRDGSDEDLLRLAVSAVYDIEEDDRALRQAVSQQDAGVQFDRLRKTYARRREFHHTRIVAGRTRESLIAKAASLGFRIETQ